MKQKHNIYGLTGGSGCGKSSAAAILKEKGFLVIDADITAREILTGDTVSELKSAFGAQIIDSDGSLNREKLAKIVFTDSEKLSLLNSITHPKIAEKIINTIAQSDKENVVIDAAALLVCKELMDICDKIIVVVANRDIRINRIMSRDGITYDAAAMRIDAQMSEDGMRAFADVVWTNNGEIEDLRSTISDYFG